MANFQQVQGQSNLYYKDGAYYKYDPTQGYVQAPAPATQAPGQSSVGPSAPAAPAPTLGTSRTPTTQPQTLSDKIYGLTPTDYQGVFNTGFENLGQPGKANQNVTIAGTQALADSFADRVLAKTGALPSEDQVRTFVAQNLTPGFAAKFITGIPKDQIGAIADNYLQGNPDILGGNSSEATRLNSLTDQLNKVYETGKQNYVNSYNDTVYNPAKTKTAEDLAGQGMLTNPNSRYALNTVESNRSRDLGSGLNTLESNRASGQVDLGKTIEDLLQKNKDRAQSGYQFNQTYNANRDDTAFNQGLQRKQLSMADMIGRLQAGQQSNNGLFGALGGGASGLTGGFASGAQAGSTLGPWGIAGLGALGAIGGYLGAKK